MQKLPRQFYQTSVTCCELKGDKDLTFPPPFFPWPTCTWNICGVRWKMLCHSQGGFGFVSCWLCVQYHTHNDLEKSGQWNISLTLIHLPACGTTEWRRRRLHHLAGKFFSFSCGFVAKLTPSKWWRRAVTLLSLQPAMATFLQKGSTFKLSGFGKDSAG